MTMMMMMTRLGVQQVRGATAAGRHVAQRTQSPACLLLAPPLPPPSPVSAATRCRVRVVRDACTALQTAPQVISASSFFVACRECVCCDQAGVLSHSLNKRCVCVCVSVRRLRGPARLAALLCVQSLGLGAAVVCCHFGRAGGARLRRRTEDYTRVAQVCGRREGALCQQQRIVCETVERAH